MSQNRTLSRRDFLKVAAAAGMAAAASGIALPAMAGKKTKMDTPAITCVDGTLHTISLQVCAGATTGAPAGFSVQWVKKSDYPALQCGASGQDLLWPPSDTTTNLCKASFSGTPGCSSYNLSPGDCVTVEIGNLNDAECGVGLSNCGADELDCGTTYVFRAFAHANSTLNRSDFTANQCCSTDPCIGACVLTQGYWKNHPCEWPSPFVPGANVTLPSMQCALTGDPNEQCACDTVNTMLIGTNSYTQCQLLCALDMPGGGNALVILAHQLIAAKLNMLSGATAPAACDIAAADALIGSLNILYDSVAPSDTRGHAMTTAAACLDLYNNGDGGVPHCP